MKREKISIRLVIQLTVLCLGTSVQASVAEYDLEQETLTVEQVANLGPGLLSHSGLTPLDVYGGYAFGVFQDAELRPWIFRVDLSNTNTNTNTITLLPLDQRTDYTFQDGSTGYYKMLNDGHHTLSLIVDGTGYIHVTADMHNYPSNPSNQAHLPMEFDHSTIIYWRSKEPYDISAFEYLGNSGGDHAPKGYGFTYQRMMRDRLGNVYLSTRNIIAKGQSYRGCKGSALTKYDVEKQAWELIGGATGVEGYPHLGMTWEDNGEAGGQYTKDIPNYVFDSRNRMHYLSGILDSDFDYGSLAASRGYTIGSDFYHWMTHGLYLRSENLATRGAKADFTKANGIPVELPARVEEGPKQGDIFAASPGLSDDTRPIFTMNTKLTYDRNDQPLLYIPHRHLLFPPPDDPETFLSLYENGQWNRYDVLGLNGELDVPDSDFMATDPNGVVSLIQYKYVYRLFHPAGQVVKHALPSWVPNKIAKNHYEQTGELYYLSADNGDVLLCRAEFTPPRLATLELSGNREMVIAAGEPFTEPGFQANDSIDGNLTASVGVFAEDLDLNAPSQGDYEMVYSVTNSLGNISTAKRYITVATGPNMVIETNQTPLAAGAEVDLGIAPDGKWLEQAFTIMNTGSTLDFSGTPTVTLSGSDDFICTRQAPASIEGGTQAAFTIHLIPSSDGVQRAEVRLLSNDTDHPDFRFTLQAANNVHHLRIMTDGTPGVEIVGATNQWLAATEPSTPVSVNVPDGYTFYGWAGASGSTNNPMTVANIERDQILIAQFMPLPELYYDLDTQGSTVVDQSGNSNTANVINTPVWIEGHEGLALNVEPSGYLHNPSAQFPHVTDEITFTLWLYGGEDANLTSSRLIFEGLDAAGEPVVMLHLYKDNIRMIVKGSDGGDDRVGYDLPNESFVKGSWQHWSFTRSANEMHLYLNGTNVASQIGMDYPLPPIASYTVGARSDGGVRYRGAIDEFKLFSRALNPDQIQQVYRNDQALTYAEQIIECDGAVLRNHATLDMGAASVGNTIEKQVTIRNLGTAPLYLPDNPVYLDGTFNGESPEFTLIPLDKTILLPGESDLFTITYAPLHNSVSEATCHIQSIGGENWSLALSAFGGNQEVIDKLTDTDGDGFTDDQETLLGTDPTAPNIYPQITGALSGPTGSEGTGTYTLSWPSADEVLYRLLQSPDLIHWFVVRNWAFADHPPFEFFETNLSFTNRFFKFEARLP